MDFPESSSARSKQLKAEKAKWLMAEKAKKHKGKEPLESIDDIVMALQNPNLRRAGKEVNKDSRVTNLKKQKYSDDAASCSNLAASKKKARTLEERENEYYMSRTRILDGTSHALRNPVHNRITNLNSNWTKSRATTQFRRGTMTTQKTRSEKSDASNFQHQPMQYQPSIAQSQLMQYQPSIAQSQLMQYGASVSPYMNTPYYEYPMHYPYFGSTSLHNLTNSSYMQWPMQQSMQSLSQQGMQYQPSISESQLFQYEASISRPPLQQPNGESDTSSVLIPYNYQYGTANSTCMQWPMLQSTQPHNGGTVQWPRTSMAYTNFYNGFSPWMFQNQERGEGSRRQ